MSKTHYEKLARMYHRAPINQLYNHRLEVGEGSTTLRWDVQPEFFHAAHALHGSAYFKMLDDAAFFAANSIVADVFVLTASFHVHFLRPVPGGLIRAEGTLVSPGRQIMVAEAVLLNEQDEELGLGTGTFSRSRIPLDEKVGYR